MTEQDLKELGFTKVKVSKKESGDKPFHYYTWEPFQHSRFGLISCASDEYSKTKGWWVEMYDDYEIKFFNKKDIKKLIKILISNLEK